MACCRRTQIDAKIPYVSSYSRKKNLPIRAFQVNYANLNATCES